MRLAVMEFDSPSSDPRLAGLGKGLQSMVTTDLAQVEKLRLVERSRIEEIKAELKLQSSKLVDKKTAVRMGKLMGASHLISGSVTVLDQQMRLDLRLFSVETSEIMVAEDILGTTPTFFELEKKLVNLVLSALGVRLNKAEQKLTGKVQTKDYEAFLDYGQAMELKEKKQYEESAELLQKAKSRDMGFQLADEALSILEALIAEVGYPKIMLLVSETYTNEKNEAAEINKPAIIGTLEEALLNQKMELVAQDQSDRLRQESGMSFSELTTNDKRAAEIASQYGAEVAIVGSAEVKFSAFNEMGANLYYVSVNVSLRAVNTSTAQILASFETVGRGVGVNEDLARTKAIRQATPTSIKKLLRGLVTSWRMQLTRGRQFKIVLLKVPSYGKVARPFIKAFQELAAVDQVKELNFGGGRLEIEVTFKGKKNELLDYIYEDIAERKKFKTLDKVLDRGDNLEFTL